MNKLSINTRKDQLDNASYPNQVKLAIEILQEFSDHLHKIYEPMWSARMDHLKTIITLSSGSLVFTVTFSGSMLSKPSPPSCIGLLFLSWVLFSITIIVALIGVAQRSSLTSLQADIQGIKVPNIILQSNLRGESPFDNLCNEAVKAISLLDPYQKRFERALLVTSMAFWSALVSLCIFGWKQLP